MSLIEKFARVLKLAAMVSIVLVIFVACKDENEADDNVNKLGGSQSPIGNVGNSFSSTNIVPNVTNISAQVVGLNNGVSSISVVATVTNPIYLAMLALAPEVEVSGNTVTINLQYRITTEGIQDVYPDGSTLNVVKYNAKVGDVYTCSYNTLRREVTVVSNKDEFSWNGMKIKTIHVKETNREIPGLDHIEIVSNHKFGLVTWKFVFTDGTTLNFPIVSATTN